MAAELEAERARIRTTQWELLRRLLDALVPDNAFYTQKWQRAGTDLAIAGLEEFSTLFPFTTKAEIVADQRAQPPYGSNLTFPIDRYTRCHQTSGTSGGAPLRWLDTPESWSWMVENWMEIFRAAGVRAGDRVFFAFSFGPFLGFWLAFQAAERLGCLCLPGGGLSSAARLRNIIDQQATVLCCTPTYAIRLAEVAAAENIDLSAAAVRTIVVAGEPGGSIAATRARVSTLWHGARLFDHHGMTEVGAVTYECPMEPGVLHVLEEAYLAEIIDSESTRPVPPGTPGELVLTTLGRTGSPLLRYRTGDMVRARPPSLCACGRAELALEGGIIGRVDDMIVVRGVNIYPAAIEEIVRSCTDVAEFQVQLHQSKALSEITVCVEAERRCANPAALAETLERKLQTAFALRMPVTLAEPGALPRFEMKAKRWIKV